MKQKVGKTACIFDANELMYAAVNAYLAHNGLDREVGDIPAIPVYGKFKIHPKSCFTAAEIINRIAWRDACRSERLVVWKKKISVEEAARLEKDGISAIAGSDHYGPKLFKNHNPKLFEDLKHLSKNMDVEASDKNGLLNTPLRSSRRDRLLSHTEAVRDLSFDP